MKKEGIFIGATGQNVGKTTICLGLISALQKQFSSLGFMKPVGQQHEKVEEGLLVDKDVVLFKEHFHLSSNYEDMSPVIFPRGFTKDFLDGHISTDALKQKIISSFHKIHGDHTFTIVEGTGHIGVGSITHLSNAEVASTLGLDAVLIVEGGLGSAFDELALNKEMCDSKGVKLRGVILNRVLEEKKEMILHYMQKALKRWDVPLIGCIPYNQLLNTPAIKDFEILFTTSLLSGERYHYRHFESMRLVATSVETFVDLTYPNQLIVTPATREDIVSALLDLHTEPSKKEPEHGLILTGRKPPSHHMLERLKKAEIPTLYAAYPSFEAMRLMTSFTAKIRKEDTSKVKKAIELVEAHLDINPLI